MNKVMDLWTLEEKPLKGQLIVSIKTKIPELVRRRQTLQREHFILKPKEVPVQSGQAKIPPTTPTSGGHFGNLVLGLEEEIGTGTEYLTEFISMSLNCVSFAFVLYNMGSFLVRTFRVMSIRLITLM